MADGDSELDLRDMEDQEEEVPSYVKVPGLTQPQASITGMPGMAALSVVPTPPPSITGMPAAGAPPPPPARSITAPPVPPLEQGSQAQAGGPLDVNSNANVPAPRPQAAHLAELTDPNKQYGVAGKHGIGGGILKALDVAGSIISPYAAAMIPGSTLNHMMQVNQARRGASDEDTAIKSGEAEREATAELGLKGAQTEQAKAAAEYDQRRASGANMQHVVVSDDKGNPIPAVFDKAQGKYFDPTTGAELPATTKMYEKPTANKLEHIAIEDPSKPGSSVMANYDSEKGVITDANGKVIPNARPFEKPTPEPGSYVPVPDPSDPLHKIVGWVDPKSGHFRSLADIHMGPQQAPISGEVKPTGQEASREGQAEVVSRAADGLTKTIEANKDKIGDVSAIIKSAFLNTPLADKDLAGIATELASFAALQPAMHGFRGQQAMNEFTKLIGGVPKNPDALISSIAAIKKTAGYFNPDSGAKGKAPTVGTVEGGYKFKGGDPSDKNNWEKQ